jgi:hypothetical protein
VPLCILAITSYEILDVKGLCFYKCQIAQVASPTNITAPRLFFKECDMDKHTNFFSEQSLIKSNEALGICHYAVQ